MSKTFEEWKKVNFTVVEADENWTNVAFNGVKFTYNNEKMDESEMESILTSMALEVWDYAEDRFNESKTLLKAAMRLINDARPHMEYLLDDCNLHDDLECIGEWLDKVKELSEGE